MGHVKVLSLIAICAVSVMAVAFQSPARAAQHAVRVPPPLHPSAAVRPSPPPRPGRFDRVPRGMMPPKGAGGAVTPAASATSSVLQYQGGGPSNGRAVIEGRPRVYIVYWGSQWGTQSTDSNGDYTFSNDPQRMAPYQQEFFKGLGTNGETWSRVMTQYCDGVAQGETSCPSNAPHVGYAVGGTLAGVWYDNSVPAPGKASGQQIAAEAINAAVHFGNDYNMDNLDNNIQYVLTSPTGTNPGGCFEGSNTSTGCEKYCAWHSDTTDLPWVDDLAYTNMPYIPDAQVHCGEGDIVPVNPHPELDGVSIVGAHEYAETMTDAYGDGGWCGTGGCAHDENGDKCAWNAPNNRNDQDVTFSTGRFAMLPTWANDGNGGKGSCEISYPLTDASLDAMWNNYGDSASCADWSGADATNSVALPGGQRAWFFSDTYLNSPAARKTLWDASVIHNSMVIQNGSQLSDTITGGNTCQETNSSRSFWDRYAKTPATPPDAGNGGFYWTGDQMVVGSDVVKFYYHGYPIALPNGGHGFSIDYPAVATIPASSLASDTALTITPTQFSCGPTGVIWGTALLDYQGSIYVYGWASTGILSSGIYLAKTTAANLNNPGAWQLYDGMNGSDPAWGTCGSTPAALSIGNPTTGLDRKAHV